MLSNGQKQVGKLQVAVNGRLKKSNKKSCAQSQSFPDMRELKNKLSHAVKQHMQSGSRMTIGACRTFCLRIMEEMETEQAGRVWVQAGKLPFEISRRWLRTFVRKLLVMCVHLSKKGVGVSEGFHFFMWKTLGLKYGEPRHRRKMLPDKQRQV